MPRPTTPEKARAKTAKVTKAPKRQRAKSEPKPVELSPELRQDMIREAAYFRAERRGFQGGDPLSDWLSSEQEVDSALSMGAH
jgi:hypothetical protein